MPLSLSPVVIANTFERMPQGCVHPACAQWMDTAGSHQAELISVALVTVSITTRTVMSSRCWARQYIREIGA
jgi:hypothetical protein